MLNRFIILLFFVISFQISDAQVVDSTTTIQIDSSEIALLDSIAIDSVKTDSTSIGLYKKKKFNKKRKKKKFFLKGILKEPYPSPRKAALLSIILPGAGQFYNKKYWKIPIVYAGVGSLAYAIYWNGSEYRHWRDQHRFRVDGIESTVDIYPRLSADAMKNLRISFFKNYQRSFVGFTIVYLLNGIEAYVDAHLLSFNVDDDLSLEFYPQTQVMHDGSTTFSLGMSLHQRSSLFAPHPGFVDLQ